MKIDFAHLCDYALVSKDGKLSVLGIFNQVRAQTLPWSHPTMYVAFQIGLEPAEVGSQFKMRVVIRDQDGGEVLSMEGDVRTHGTAKIGDSPSSKQVLGLNGVTFKKPGPHEIVFWLNGQLKHTLSFEVKGPQTSA